VPIKFPPNGVAQSVIATQTITQGIMDDAPTIGWPTKNKGKYTCTCRAQCRGDCLNPGENQQYGIATAVGNNLPVTKNEAKKAAEGLISCQGKHTTCKCTGPKGEHIPEGGR
jgi:hypothetical protein